MTVIFLLLIIAFAAIAFWYVYANDFNSATQSIIFPSVGAILLSCYLGYKTIWIDAPKPVVHRTNVILMLDKVSGKVSTPVMPWGLAPQEFDMKFRGLRKINGYTADPAFKDIDVWSRITKENSVEETWSLIADIMEYAILDWFTQEDTRVGLLDSNTMVMLKGSSKQFNWAPNIRLVPITVGRGSSEWNPFIKAKDLTLMLPAGSVVNRYNPTNSYMHLSIETPHSMISMRITGMGGGSFIESSSDPIGKNIRDFLHLKPYTPELLTYGFPVVITTSQKPIVRFSDAAVLEAKWLERLPKLFDDDFSWDQLRAFYTSNKPIIPGPLPPEMLAPHN